MGAGILQTRNDNQFDYNGTSKLAAVRIANIDHCLEVSSLVIIKYYLFTKYKNSIFLDRLDYVF